MKFLTLNTHSWMEENAINKMKQLAAFIHEEQIDIVALQEVNQSVTESIVDSPTHFANPDHEVIKSDNFALLLANYLKTQFHEIFTWTWTKNHIGFDRFDEGVALLIKQPINRVFRLPISKSTNPNDFHTRVAVGAELENKMTVISLHASWWISPQTKELCFPYEMKQLNQFAQYHSSPIFLMGDFNNPSHIKNEGYQLITQNWFDTYSLANHSIGHDTMTGAIAGWQDNKHGQRIDFIFSNQSLPIKEARVVFDGREQPLISDHFGYMITF